MNTSGKNSGVRHWSRGTETWVTPFRDNQFIGLLWSWGFSVLSVGSYFTCILLNINRGIINNWLIDDTLMTQLKYGRTPRKESSPLSGVIPYLDYLHPHFMENWFHSCTIRQGYSFYVCWDLNQRVCDLYWDTINMFLKCKNKPWF